MSEQFKKCAVVYHGESGHQIIEFPNADEAAKSIASWSEWITHLREHQQFNGTCPLCGASRCPT